MQGGEGRRIIDVAFVELRLDQRRLHIRRDQQAIDGRVGDHVVLQLRQLGDGTRRLQRIVIGLGSEAAHVVEEDLARRAVRQATDQVVVDAGQVVDALCRFVDQLEGFIVEDGAFVHLDRHDDHVGAAEVLLQAVVDLDVLVVLRQQVGKVGEYAQAGQGETEKAGDEEDDREDDLRIGKNPFLALMQGVRNGVT